MMSPVISRAELSWVRSGGQKPVSGSSGPAKATNARSVSGGPEGRRARTRRFGAVASISWVPRTSRGTAVHVKRACRAHDVDGWLGRKGSNLRMLESKSSALPLGDAPSCGQAGDHIEGVRAFQRGESAGI